MSETQTVDYAPPIPPAVARAAARANDLVREQATAPATTVGEPGPAPTPAPETLTRLPSAPLASSVPPPPVPPAPPAAAPAAQPPTDEWKQRYDSLQGKYNSEVPQLRAQLDGVQRLLAQLSAPRPEPAPTPAAAPAVSDDAIAKDKQEFGPELFDAVQRWVLATVNPRLVEIEQHLGRLGQAQGQVRTETAQQRVMAALDADTQLGQVWRQLNSDQAFMAWLEHQDPFTGEVRKNLLGTAFNRGDAIRTAAFFRAYIGEHTATTPAPTLQPPTPPPGDGRPTLDSMAAPGRPAGNPGSSGASGEKRVWTKEDISAFYRAKTSGGYRGREAEALALEQDIIAAGTEGRVR